MIARPRYYPHWGTYTYTRTPDGHFDRRVVKRLTERRFRLKDIRWLERLYFYDASVLEHCDDLGNYINRPRNHLYRLSCKMSNNCKTPLILLVIRSGLFEVGFSKGRSRVEWFRSPYAGRRFGAIF